MSTELKLRGGTTTQHGSFTGAAKEITVDTTLWTIRVHDGSTVGGIRLARFSEVAGFAPLAGATFTGNTSVTRSGANAVVAADRTGAAVAGRIEMIAGDSTNALISYGTKVLALGTDGAEDMRIETNGSVHIGGSGGTYKHNVYDSANAYTLYKAGGNAGLVVGQDVNGDAFLLNLTNATVRLGTNGSERARLSAAGGWSVGTTSDAGAGGIFATGNITAFFSSDRRLKENVREIPNALLAVEHIGGKLFDWTDDYLAKRGGEHEYFNRKHDFGVIAQDVEAFLPEAVRTRDDGTLAVDYEKLCALAFAAIKELSAKVAALESK